MPEPTPIQDIRDAARHYLAAGLYPIPLSSPNSGGKSPGKRPVHDGWQKGDQPVNPDSYSPDLNVGLRMGHQPCGQFLVTFDVDSEDISELEKMLPGADWPSTLYARTGRLGYHLLYSWPTGLTLPSNSVKLGGSAVDLRSEGGQIVVEPSTHALTGRRYEWQNQSPIAELPIEIAQQILQLQNTGRKPSQRVGANSGTVNSAVAADSLAGSTTSELFKLSDSRFKTLLRRLSNRNSAVAASFEAMLHNRPIAEQGNRDDTITRMCYALAQEVPNADPQSIAAHFQESLSLLEAIQPFASPCDIGTKFSSAVRKIESQAATEICLKTTQTGTPVACTHNVLILLRQDRELAGHFAYDQFAERVVIAKPLPWDREKNPDHYPRPFADEDTTLLSDYVMGKHRLNASTQQLFESIGAVAKENTYHPVQEYLRNLVWDGVPRLDTWLIDLAGAPDTEYVRKVSSWWAMSACMRVISPGCQADYCLILEGQQGVGKSQLLKALASPTWFTDECPDFQTKDAAINLAGKWIIELSELGAIHSARDANTVKSFVSRSTDRYRPPFGRVAQDMPRQCVFAGTTNDSEYLVDNTGNRRFWPVEVKMCTVNVARAAEIRDQLWAEAVCRLARGEVYYPKSMEERAIFEREADQRRLVDIQEEKIQLWMEHPVAFPASGAYLTSDWLCENVLNLEKPNRNDGRHLNAILRKLGWSRKSGSGYRYWLPPETFKAPDRQLAQVLPLKKAGT